MKYTLWVNLEQKAISLTELDGFTKYVYDSEAGLNRVLKMLAADGFRMYQLAV